MVVSLTTRRDTLVVNKNGKVLNLTLYASRDTLVLDPGASLVVGFGPYHAGASQHTVDMGVLAVVIGAFLLTVAITTDRLHRRANNLRRWIEATRTGTRR